MKTWMRFGAWVLCLAGLTALWHLGVFGAAAAVVIASVGAVLLLALPGRAARRRREALQYVQMGKQPVGLF